MFDGTKFGEEIVKLVKGYLARKTAEISGRLDATNGRLDAQEKRIDDLHTILSRKK